MDPYNNQYQQPYFQPHPSGNIPPKKSNTGIIVIIAAAVLILIGLSVVIFFLASGKNVKEKGQSTNTETKDETTNRKTEQPVIAQITELEVKGFVNEWASAQSNLNIQKYISMYARDFQGIKRTKSGKIYNLNYDDWVKDRTKMYSGKKFLSVTADNIKVSNINKTNNTAEVTFYQYYSSTSYSDEGQKLMKVRKETDNDIKIYYEELLYSTTNNDEGD